MDVIKGGSRPTRVAPKEYFTGPVFQDPVIEAAEPSRQRATYVTFGPGGRTGWHTHPLGQTLYIVSGTGRVQAWGGPVREVRAGDVVWFAPNEKHWHGASPAHAMVHLAMQEALNGTFIEWGDLVTDEQYARAPEA
jgi:quercetin dioxygenase-like cupin family protein